MRGAIEEPKLPDYQKKCPKASNAFVQNPLLTPFAFVVHWLQVIPQILRPQISTKEETA